MLFPQEVTQSRVCGCCCGTLQAGDSADTSKVEAAAAALTAACAAQLQTIKDAHLQGAQQLEQSLQAAKSAHRQRIAQRIAERRSQQANKLSDDDATRQEEEAEPIADARFEAECIEAMLTAQAQVETLMMNALSIPADQTVAQSMQEAHKVGAVCVIVSNRWECGKS
jgi:hypothetical protein